MNADGSSGIGRREQKRADTRLAIQRAAVELFEEHGYDATTVDDIARRANVAPRTFFRYFPSKELTLFSEDVSERFAALVLDAPPHLPPLDALESALARLLEDAPSELDRRRQALRRTLHEQPGVTRQFAHVQDLIAERLRAAFLRRLQDGGAPRPGLTADATVAIYLGLARTLVDGDPDQRERIREWFDAVRAVLGESRAGT
ncbi:TetR family transcriptional regulator [Nocardiopsis composta]|uniref:AcrR family transcriptional regulator n=1 Tax=Nocardiopsis composta TaxID=157465 RepID=A0A7W8QHX4_9ACTN|nr:TetR family transcriptional regulator [Nocardiopsis composta]MBB5430519.1 AcrR family transcriptional regulator [Nocardiopsis composta]